MTKKVMFLAGLLVFLMACVVTSPSEMFQTTPTMCVECVQSTICAENQTGDACPVNVTIGTEELTPSITIKPTQTPVRPTSESSATIKPTRTEELSPTIKPTETEIPTQTEPIASTGAPTLRNVVEAAPAVQTTPLPEIATPTVYLTQTGDWLYKAQTGSPKYTKNFVHPKLSCSWSGVAGQVFGPGGVPQPDVVVVVSGDANGTPVNEMGYTGSAPGYGESGYEIVLPTGPANTKESMMIQLLDLKGNELSMRYVFDTYIDCKKALIIYNFVLAK
jgi:hypothetical protein